MDDYWRLEESPNDSGLLRDELVAGGYTNVPKSATLENLSEEWMRMQCGLLHYDACTIVELRRFISDRRLQVPEEMLTDAQRRTKRPPGRRQMTNLLKEHDDHQIFNKFLQLPNELQSLVCELHMDFTSTLSTPTQPPLARTCRHLRRLVLPIFYSSQRFAISYTCRKRGVHMSFRKDERDLKLERDERLWLSCLFHAHLACIKSLYLISSSFDGISIDLEKTRLGFNVKVVDLDPSMGGIVTKKQLQGLKRELRKVLGEVEWVEGMRRFKLEDIHALRGGLEAAYVDLDKPLGLQN